MKLPTIYYLSSLANLVSMELKIDRNCNTIYLYRQNLSIYKSDGVCLSVCASARHALVSCSIKLAVVAEGTGGQVFVGLTLPIFPFAERFIFLLMLFS